MQLKVTHDCHVLFNQSSLCVSILLLLTVAHHTNNTSVACYSYMCTSVLYNNTFIATLIHVLHVCVPAYKCKNHSIDIPLAILSRILAQSCITLCLSGGVMHDCASILDSIAKGIFLFPRFFAHMLHLHIQYMYMYIVCIHMYTCTLYIQCTCILRIYNVHTQCTYTYMYIKL